MPQTRLNRPLSYLFHPKDLHPSYHYLSLGRSFDIVVMVVCLSCYYHCISWMVVVTFVHTHTTWVLSHNSSTHTTHIKISPISYASSILAILHPSHISTLTSRVSISHILDVESKIVSRSIPPIHGVSIPLTLLAWIPISSYMDTLYKDPWKRVYPEHIHHLEALSISQWLYASNPKLVEIMSRKSLYIIL